MNKFKLINKTSSKHRCWTCTAIKICGMKPCNTQNKRICWDEGVNAKIRRNKVKTNEKRKIWQEFGKELQEDCKTKNAIFRIKVRGIKKGKKSSQ